MVSSHNSTNWPKINSIRIPCTPPFMLRRKESSTMMSNSQWLVEECENSLNTMRVSSPLSAINSNSLWAAWTLFGPPRLLLLLLPLLHHYCHGPCFSFGVPICLCSSSRQARGSQGPLVSAEPSWSSVVSISNCRHHPSPSNRPKGLS